MSQIKAKHTALGLSSGMGASPVISVTDTEGRVWVGNLYGPLIQLVLPEEPTRYTRAPLMPR